MKNVHNACAFACLLMTAHHDQKGQSTLARVGLAAKCQCGLERVLYGGRLMPTQDAPSVTARPPPPQSQCSLGRSESDTQPARLQFDDEDGNFRLRPGVVVGQNGPTLHESCTPLGVL